MATSGAADGRRLSDDAVADRGLHEAGRGRGGQEDGPLGAEYVLETHLQPLHERLDARAPVADHRLELGLEHLGQHLGGPGQEELAESLLRGARHRGPGRLHLHVSLQRV